MEQILASEEKNKSKSHTLVQCSSGSLYASLYYVLPETSDTANICMLMASFLLM